MQEGILLPISKIGDYIKIEDPTKVKYDPSLRDKILYPQMLNIGHVYAYYSADEPLQEALKDNLDLLPAIDNFSALKRYLGEKDKSKSMINSIVNTML